MSQAVAHGVKENRLLLSGTNKPYENDVMYGEKPMTAIGMGFSFWEQHKVAILTDLFIVMTAVFFVGASALAVFSLPSGGMIVVASITLAITAIFCIGSEIGGYRANIDYLSNKIARRLEAAWQEAEHATNKEL